MLLLRIVMNVHMYALAHKRLLVLAIALSLCYTRALSLSLSGAVGSMIQSFIWGHLAANCCVGSYIHIRLYECLYICVCERDFTD